MPHKHWKLSTFRTQGEIADSCNPLCQWNAYPNVLSEAHATGRRRLDQLQQPSLHRSLGIFHTSREDHHYGHIQHSHCIHGRGADHQATLHFWVQLKYRHLLHVCAQYLWDVLAYNVITHQVQCRLQGWPTVHGGGLCPFSQHIFPGQCEHHDAATKGGPLRRNYACLWGSQLLDILSCTPYILNATSTRDWQRVLLIPF